MYYNREKNTECEVYKLILRFLSALWPASSSSSSCSLLRQYFTAAHFKSTPQLTILRHSTKWFLSSSSFVIPSTRHLPFPSYRTQHTRLIHILSSFKSRHERTGGRRNDGSAHTKRSQKFYCSVGGIKNRWRYQQEKRMIMTMMIFLSSELGRAFSDLLRERVPYEWNSLWAGGNEASGKSNGAGWNDEECKLCVEDWKVCLWISRSLLFFISFQLSDYWFTFPISLQLGLLSLCHIIHSTRRYIWWRRLSS